MLINNVFKSMQGRCSQVNYFFPIELRCCITYIWCPPVQRLLLILKVTSSFFLWSTLVNFQRLHSRILNLSAADLLLEPERSKAFLMSRSSDWPASQVSSAGAMRNHHRILKFQRVVTPCCPFLLLTKFSLLYYQILLIDFSSIMHQILQILHPLTI